MSAPCGQRSRRRPQRGAAAIELVAVLTPLFGILYAVATFGAVSYTQQALARAAEDGARAVATLPDGALPDPQRISGVVYDSLAASLVVPLSAGGAATGRRAWIANNVRVSVAGTTVVQVSVSYPYGQNRVLPSIPLLDMSRWLPDLLLEQATLANPA